MIKSRRIGCWVEPREFGRLPDALNRIFSGYVLFAGFRGKCPSLDGSRRHIKVDLVAPQYAKKIVSFRDGGKIVTEEIDFMSDGDIAMLPKNLAKRMARGWLRAKTLK